MYFNLFEISVLSINVLLINFLLCGEKVYHMQFLMNVLLTLSLIKGHIFLTT